jgi:hypothetical protein
MPQPRSRHLLKVFVNPFAALDHNGMPFGLVRYDPDYGRKGVVHFVGASTKTTYADPRAASRAFAIATIGDGQAARVLRFSTVVLPERKTEVAYELDVDGDGKADVQVLAVQSVEHSDYHLARIRDRELVPADEATAKLVRADWRDPVVVIEEERKLRIDEHVAAYGEPPPVDTWPTFAIAVPKQADEAKPVEKAVAPPPRAQPMGSKDAAPPAGPTAGPAPVLEVAPKEPAPVDATAAGKGTTDAPRGGAKPALPEPK